MTKTFSRLFCEFMKIYFNMPFSRSLINLWHINSFAYVAAVCSSPNFFFYITHHRMQHQLFYLIFFSKWHIKMLAHKINHKFVIKKRWKGFTQLVKQFILFYDTVCFSSDGRECRRSDNKGTQWQKKNTNNLQFCNFYKELPMKMKKVFVTILMKSFLNK